LQDGVVVIGEGEKDEAPMLYCGKWQQLAIQLFALESSAHWSQHHTAGVLCQHMQAAEKDLQLLQVGQPQYVWHLHQAKQLCLALTLALLLLLLLSAGEQIGDGTPPMVDIAVDPLDGTTLTAQGRSGAIAVRQPCC
jgi:hypothetical protein